MVKMEIVVTLRSRSPYFLGHGGELFMINPTPFKKLNPHFYIKIKTLAAISTSLSKKLTTKIKKNPPLPLNLLQTLYQNKNQTQLPTYQTHTHTHTHTLLNTLQPFNINIYFSYRVFKWSGSGYKYIYMYIYMYIFILFL